MASFAIAGALAVAAIRAQSPNQARDFDAEIRAAVASAKQAAGFEFQGALVRVCLQPPQIGAENTSDTVPGYVSNPASAPARSTWYAEPAKVFDDFYFVGGKIHSAWALTTSEGIILFDTIFPYNSDELIVGGLKKLGLDPTTIKYVIVTHGHGDHIGGAQMLQEEFGAKVVMGGPDWDAVEKYPNRFKTMAPKREIVATDGMNITLGGKTVTLWLTPGHTPGTFAFTTTVLDRGKPVNIVSRRESQPVSSTTVRIRESRISRSISIRRRNRGKGGRDESHGSHLQPLGVRRCRGQESDAGRTWQWPTSIRGRRRRRAEIFQGRGGLRESGADWFGETGRNGEQVAATQVSPSAT